MLVGALALVLLDAEHSDVAKATAALFRTLPSVESFRLGCGEYPLRNSQDLLRVLSLHGSQDGGA
eukprot:2495909-Alexandrium_andersonii.AAC.1